MKRIDCLKLLAPQIHDQLVVVTLGVTEQEWDMVKHRDGNLLLSGMGNVTPFGLGVALALPHRKVVVLESDGSLLFGLNSLATVSVQKPDNLIIIVFDNECYESIGGAPSHTAGGADLAGIAREAGIRNATTVRELDAFSRETERQLAENALSLVVAKIEPSIADVPPRYYHLFEERNRFVRYIEETERISVLRPIEYARRNPTKWLKK
jgi:thiamine pyrophosphate-dependent acetolactate synthase large subunit-like protein